MVDSAQRSPGERLHELRVLAGLSARALGRLAGVAPNTITNIERGKTPTPLIAGAVMRGLRRAQRQHRALAEALDGAEVLWPEYADDDAQVAA